MQPSTTLPKSFKLLSLKALLLLALGLFIAGVSSPIMTITQFLFLESNFSILSGLSDLLEQQQYILFAIISLLSLCLPLVKIALLTRMLFTKQHSAQLEKSLNLIHNYGRWAMLDVLVVAILLVSIKLGAIASVEIHAGLYWFAASVLIVMFVTHQASNMFKQDT
jgi:paraquat-inducible protein A